MNRDQFLRQHQPDWKRFEELLARMEVNNRKRRLNGDEIGEFSALYRSLCYDLSLIQSRDWGESVGRYLNNLAARGHNALYRPRPGSFRTIYEFLSVGFPRLLRENIAYFWVALALFLIPAVAAATVVARDPSMAGRIMKGQDQSLMDEMYSQSISDLEARNAETNTIMAGFYVRNNVGIAFKCFALGAFVGIGTMSVLVFNGIYLGAVTGLMIGLGNGRNFLEFVIGHGSFELTAIVISGAAGLIIGHAIVHPGDRSRWDAIRTRGLDAVQIALGAGAMLIVAAAIEGYWSPSKIPFEVKLVVGVLLWSIVIAYLVLAGRESTADFFEHILSRSRKSFAPTSAKEANAA